MNELQSKLESILFVASKPTATALLVKLTGASEAEVADSLRALAETRAQSGIIVMEANGQWQLGTNPSNVDLVKAFLTADLREKLTDATVEVLGIIAYRQPIAKAEIEAIRGVNCQYSIRQLLMRGLIEKVVNPQDSRTNLYQVTTEFLQHMGLGSVGDLPEFEKLAGSIKLPETPQAKPEQQQETTEATPSQVHASAQPHAYADPTGIHVEPKAYEQHVVPTGDAEGQPYTKSTHAPEDASDELAEDDTDEDDDEF